MGSWPSKLSSVDNATKQSSTKKRACYVVLGISFWQSYFIISTDFHPDFLHLENYPQVQFSLLLNEVCFTVNLPWNDHQLDYSFKHYSTDIPAISNKEEEPKILRDDGNSRQPIANKWAKSNKGESFISR